MGSQARSGVSTGRALALLLIPSPILLPVLPSHPPFLHPTPQSHLSSPLLPIPHSCPPRAPLPQLSIPSQGVLVITASKPAQQVPGDPALPQSQVRRWSGDPPTPAAGCLKTPIISSVQGLAQPAWAPGRGIERRTPWTQGLSCQTPQSGTPAKAQHLSALSRHPQV